MLNFDVIMDAINRKGRAQIFMYLLLCYYMFFAGFNSLATVFIAYLPSYRCDVSPLDEIAGNESHLLEITTPKKANGRYDGCYRYGYNLTSCNATLDCVDTSAPAVKCDNGYVYNRDVISESVITEFDLVCDDYNMIALSTSFYQVGKLFGSLAFGNFADRYGRRMTCIMTFLGAQACSFAVGFCPGVVSYMVLRAVTAAFAYGTTIGTFVYIMEITSVEYRTLCGIGYQAFFSLGYMIQSGIAYHWRNWHDIMLVCNIITTPFLLIAILMPESPRWLFAMDRTEEGKKVVRQMARVNGVKLDEADLWKRAEMSDAEARRAQGEGKPANTYSSLDLFKLRGTRLITLNVMFSWFVNTLVYYGVGLNTGALAGDLFLNNTLNGVMEISSYIVAIWLLDRVGRRRTLAGGFMVASIGLIMSLVLVELADDKPSLLTASVVFAFMGRVGISAAFAIIYNMTTELYPTVTRSNGIAMGSVAGRVGGILAPFIISLQVQYRWLPNVIFGGLGLIAAAATLAFPETNRCKMMETIDDAEYFYRHGRMRADDVSNDDTGSSSASSSVTEVKVDLADEKRENDAKLGNGNLAYSSHCEQTKI